jgi:hypothetical protein
MKQELYTNKGRKFVLLCGCNTIQKTLEPYAKSNERFGDQVFTLSIEYCNKCRYFKWIILPKGEKA